MADNSKSTIFPSNIFKWRCYEEGFYFVRNCDRHGRHIFGEINANADVSAGKHTNEKNSQHIKNNAGNINYLITFHQLDPLGNPNAQRKGAETLLSIASRYKEVPLTLDLLIEASAIEKIAPPESLASIDYLKEYYDIDAKIVSFAVGKTVAAYLNEEQVKNLVNDPLIAGVSPNRPVELSSWTDYDYGFEVRPWGTEPTNTVTPPNGGTVFVIDMPLPNMTIPAEIPIAYKAGANYTAYGIHGGPLNFSNIFHGLYVSSIIAARSNSVQSRGVISGSINHYGLASTSDAGIISGLDYVYLASELSGTLDSANLSLNGGTFPTAGGALNTAIKILSNRVLLAQSAGNFKEDACLNAYVPTDITGNSINQAHAMDGVMVVGAYDQDGNQATGFSDSGFPPDWIGSNVGDCVDIWAPGRNISISTAPDVANVFLNQEEDSLSNPPNNSHATIAPRGYIISSGGTSWAAPVVAGISAAISNNSTIRPPQLESAIRATSAPTGGVQPLEYLLSN